jgi:hypothetical protein
VAQACDGRHAPCKVQGTKLSPRNSDSESEFNGPKIVLVLALRGASLRIPHSALSIIYERLHRR